ncbi:5-hydroxyisourate hydrolase-like protein [Gonapodya prolifera JEL478]|uniref:5-hydroxyisourate hydrolase n=1 Tax=Gonapodya prolifera (strain JEL478) TaxID=1344416 RepID=A0A139ASF1_GONPJ|nr:5-hydroxyisourate hydrolase-like protein [Gonapodya prolifera JEL478]|eukprot:KXS19415.1 5-hydroxyisourate hydrolase-like protein [Gonapodya prolifera JEL478]
MAPGQSPITCHILDTMQGKAADGVAVSLELAALDNSWSTIGKGVTNADGRVNDLLTPSHQVVAGTYRLKFETKPYFTRTGLTTFFPFVQVTFEIPSPPQPHYHVPLLLSPYSYTTYRGT